MPKLVLLRHGQSQWNLENRFTGWVDVDLTAEGEAQAKRGGELMKKAGLHIDQAFTSVLTRAIRTCQLALQSMGESDVPVTKDWRLNERHYGGLTGLNKAETAEKHGEEQVKIWRRSYDVPPPPLGADSPYDFANDPRYEGAVLPNTESLKTTLERVLPFWTAAIVPVLRRGDTVLIAAHGNSIRAIIKSLFDLSDEAILDVEVPTGNPLVIQLDGNLKPLQAEYLDTARANPLPEVA